MACQSIATDRSSYKNWRVLNSSFWNPSNTSIALHGKARSYSRSESCDVTHEPSYEALNLYEGGGDIHEGDAD